MRVPVGGMENNNHFYFVVKDSELYLSGQNEKERENAEFQRAGLSKEPPSDMKGGGGWISTPVTI